MPCINCHCDECREFYAQASKPYDVLLDEGVPIGIETFVACCSYPPGDGSTCAGGTCCCREDYVCDKCKEAKLKDGTT